MKSGESKTFPLAFPADYHGKDVAGKTADFLVTIKKIEAAHLPEVNDALAKRIENARRRLMREVAADGPWASKLVDAAGQRTEMASASDYYSMLRPHCARVDVWRTTYHHPLAGGASGVVEWFKGSGLRPFLEPLDDAEKAQYLKQYHAAIEQAYPALSDGSVLLPFPRLFIVATR